MKLLAIVSIAALCLATVAPTRTTAQESDYVCFWQKPDGTMMDMSNFCRQSSSKTKLSGDAAFVADFQAMASQYPDNIRQALDSYIQQNRDSAIASAKTTCRVLRTGGMLAQSKRRGKLAANDSVPTEQARVQIIEPLAISHYCPEFASQ